ncbi:M20/M25/M40 family metallo-hydrolase [Ktedonosporobacter rubrisoli]|uniref:M20/M25/M40 family metallo-hydrolase n=1 Tax=Ktedonosporobacter rubrisoli TaxID=2509675 RepID=A0A4P6JTA6_KTERU|nr:M20/M25/M40 family metallo-hydrolase [Ktedonosporobacter rubrisoli]QBD78809.1 M20/M25/M40 family metallo-hydrolase [Ktedonosporobacter rubrisoli]
MTVADQLRVAARQQVEAVVELAMRICKVPAPTGSEQERASFVASLWRERGYTPEIDAVNNVYVRRGARADKPVLMLLAHTDTVFPASTALVVKREGDIVYGPGISDNSASVAAMIKLLDILDALQVETAVDIVAVANVGEEGLGNLRGARAAVERYRKQLGAVIAIDGRLGNITHIAVGSKRWRITVRGPGGHSFGSFGTPSAIHGLGRIIAALADLEVPQQPKTTFNVGMIEGGTSVNSIAASASALLDLRSIDVAALDRLAKQARAIIEQRAGQGLQAEIEVLGERPAGARSLSDPLVTLAAETLKELGIKPQFSAASTDINIPISLNIPSVCVGLTHGERAHTLEEYLQVPPIADGLAQLLRLCIDSSRQIAKRA